jgi:uncharacterized protein YndB with AHSA1/START domain
LAITINAATPDNWQNIAMPLKTRGFALRIDIGAPVESVWTSFCGPTLVPLWLGEDARLRPQQGGSWSATIAPGLARHAMIDVFDPPRRLRLIYLPPDDLSAFDGAVADDVLFEGDGQRTIVRLLCSGVPDLPEWNSYFVRVRQANERALSRLKTLVESRA